MKCPVCKCEWSEKETSVRYSRKKDVKKVMRIFAPCGHGYAYLIRQYDLISTLWYYEQIDFIR